ncbi:YdeI/OmpD-associated family protein [Pedobacter panaciterrae]|uniref:YdeI/OmpD-associated family protein n=1 Tax=Pedobacter panaciterrae TaxID=363849 RepID=A0ABU8NK35_9SPHI
MENGLLKKIYFKPGFKVLLANAPKNGTAILGDVSSISLVNNSADDFNGLLLFVKDSSELNRELKIWAPKIDDKKTVWIAYPKKTSGIVTDLKMEKWNELELYKLTPCASAAIDDTWTGIRIKPIDQVKASGVGNNEIKKNEFSEFIDVENKKVTVPSDLAKLFLQHPQAQSFFETLAYSHKKEYVLWILTAKQEQTRIGRLQKTIEMLLVGKKNPTMK